MYTGNAQRSADTQKNLIGIARWQIWKSAAFYQWQTDCMPPSL
jgi:hypothetical protein